MFRFNGELRIQVTKIVDVMLWANNCGKSGYAGMNSVYGGCSKALKSIINAECGSDIMDLIDCSRNGWNFGGNESYTVDVEVAVQAAIDERTEALTHCCE